MVLTINAEAKLASKGQEHISQNGGYYDLEMNYIPKAPVLWTCSPADSFILKDIRNSEVGLGLRKQITIERPWEYSVPIPLFSSHCGVYNRTCSHHHEILPLHVDPGKP